MCAKVINLLNNEYYICKCNWHMIVLILLNIVAGTDTSSKSGISTGALVGIILGSIACVISMSAIFILLVLRIRLRRHDAVSKPHHCEFLLTMNHLLFKHLRSTDTCD